MFVILVGVGAHWWSGCLACFSKATVSIPSVKGEWIMNYSLYWFHSSFPYLYLLTPPFTGYYSVSLLTIFLLSTAFLPVLLTPAVVLVQTCPPWSAESTPPCKPGQSHMYAEDRLRHLAPVPLHHLPHHLPFELIFLLYLLLCFTFRGVTHLYLALIHTDTSTHPTPYQAWDCELWLWC